MEVEGNTSHKKNGVGTTPKSLISQKYGSNASYRIEEVQEVIDGGCPGLKIGQQTKVLYRCFLDLPGLSVVSSGTFTKKKDAEQSAAKAAMEKLGIEEQQQKLLTPDEAWTELVSRISAYFSERFLSSTHPIVGHVREALRKMEDNVARIPLSIILSCDTKVSNLCKIIDANAEFDPSVAMSLLTKAASLSDLISVADDKLLLQNKIPFSPEIVQSLLENPPSSVDALSVDTVRIPCAMEEEITPSSLCVSSGYYLDTIASQLNLSGSYEVFVSKPIGKSSSETRLYFPVPDAVLSFCSSKNFLSDTTGAGNVGKLINKRASYLAGQTVYGDAILATVSYKWKTPDLFTENVTLSLFYRLMLGKLPYGIYKLSRDAILAAELPSAYARNSWRCLDPRSILSTFCRQQGLLEPVFHVYIAPPRESLKDCRECCKKLKTDNDQQRNGVVCAPKDDEEKLYKCDVKICSRKSEVVVEYIAVEAYGKENDAKNDSSLKIIQWFCDYLKQIETPVEKLCGSTRGVKVHAEILEQEFAPCRSALQLQKECDSIKSTPGNQLKQRIDNAMAPLDNSGSDSGVCLSVGSLSCITYTASLLVKDSDERHVLESNEKFEFEIGTGAVISQLESCVMQLSVDQSAKFRMELPPQDLVLAAAGDSATALSKLSPEACFLEFDVKLLRVTEPMEERMEKALFDPPLSKQRVEFAVKHINALHATSLVDFGCGSGSLLDSLLGHKTTLTKLVGVDISRKALTRAAKSIHQKLSKSSVLHESVCSAILYEGSITEFDSRVFGFDIGTCLEVIEHMEEDQAQLFGTVVLTAFRPRILIVSTPNYEYNPILRRSSQPGKEELDEKAGPCKFRNFDHKFEWTRAQFQQWATDLATAHGYSVEFSGVGGSGDEPGFASQIALFRRNPGDEDTSGNDSSAEPYELLWEWNREAVPM